MEIFVGLILGLTIGLLFWYNEMLSHRLTKKSMTKLTKISDQNHKSMSIWRKAYYDVKGIPHR